MIRRGLIVFSLMLFAVTAQAEYTTSVDVYLDMDVVAANGTIWELSSAINTADDGSGNCGHRRDFIFNCGYYSDSDITGSGARYVCSASNNSVGNPKDPGRSPFAMFDTGWYTFEHHFYDGGAGVLAVDLNIYDDVGVLLNTWTLSTAADIIGVTVGGNRYGWFVVVGCTSVAGGSCTALDPSYELAIDESRKCATFGCDFEQGFETDLDGWFGAPFLLERVASGTGGVASSAGGFHAVVSAVNRAFLDPVSGDFFFVFTRWGGYQCTFGAGSVVVDLRPGTDSNHINTRAKQQVPIAILGSESFNPCEEVDEITTLRDKSPPSRSDCDDVDGDGDDDLLFYFRANDLTKPNEVECNDPDATVELTGFSTFGVPFSGTDHVRWQGPDCN